MPRVKKAITQTRAATMGRMNSHLITTTARTIPSTTSAASRSRRNSISAVCPRRQTLTRSGAEPTPPPGRRERLLVVCECVARADEEATRQLQAAESGAEDHDVLHAAPTPRSSRRIQVARVPPLPVVSDL